MGVPPTVSAVVVNYNGEQFLQACLNSILAQSRAPAEVVVVDNHSTDTSLDILASQTDARIQTLPLEENLGFAEACNRGIRQSRGDLVAILNNDIVLDPNWLGALLAHDSPEWSFWASKIVFASPSGCIDSAGDGMAVVGSGFKIGHGRPAGDFTETREVFGACAAAALYRRSLLEDVGGFDPDFFLVYEDADLNFRARLRGHRCLFVADAEVIHRVNTSIGTFSHTYVFYGHRNSEFVFLTNMPTPLLLLFLPERMLFNLLAFLFFLFKGRGGSFLRAKASALFSWKRIVRKRRAVQAARLLGQDQLRPLLERNWLAYRRKFSRQ